MDFPATSVVPTSSSVDVFIVRMELAEMLIKLLTTHLLVSDGLLLFVRILTQFIRQRCYGYGMPISVRGKMPCVKPRLLMW
jgi:hypothetical protein